MTSITAAPPIAVPEQPNVPPPPKTEDLLHPPLEEFYCPPPALRFINLRKLAQASQDVRAYQKAIMSYHPHDHFPDITSSAGIEATQDFFNPEPPDSPTEQTDALPTSMLEQLPSYAPTREYQDLPDDPEFAAMIKKHAAEREKLAYEFRREQAQILTNYYDAQLRENMKKNEMIDHRPISDALRHISKRIAYPSDLGVQRFYKYNIRCEKITRKHKKALEKLQASQELRSDVLYQKQLQDIQTYGDINHTDVSEFKISKLPTPVPPDVV